jgi:hypothetical protein
LKPICKSYKNNSINNGSIEDTTITEYFTTFITEDPENILLSEDYAFCQMWRGLGKVLWFGPFRVGFYGAAAQKKQLAAQKA